ncbi:hypothetical protein LSAT2_005155, partial [Lamellibrachia satsuma]
KKVRQRCRPGMWRAGCCCRYRCCLSPRLQNCTGDVALTTAGSPWVVKETVYVEEKGSLTVEPGVTVLLASGVSLVVDGQLVAEGMYTQLVQFTLLDSRNITEGKLNA